MKALLLIFLGGGAGSAFRFLISKFFYINKGEWHQLINEEDDPLIVIEMQFGDKCDEEDIERLFYYD